MDATDLDKIRGELKIFRQSLPRKAVRYLYMVMEKKQIESDETILSRLSEYIKQYDEYRWAFVQEYVIADMNVEKVCTSCAAQQKYFQKITFFFLAFAVA